VLGEGFIRCYMRLFFAVLLLTALILALAAPGVTLPRTTLDAQQQADATFWLLTAAAVVLLGALPRLVVVGKAETPNPLPDGIVLLLAPAVLIC
jgi:hypothetical protein